jgi:hypothetical protein
MRDVDVTIIKSTNGISIYEKILINEIIIWIECINKKKNKTF